MSKDETPVQREREPVRNHEPYDVRNCCQVHGCSPEELAEAISIVGQDPEQLCQYFDFRKQD